MRIITPLNLTHCLVLFSTLLHVWVASHVNLGVDEAHYALYGHFLAGSYYDHPPMVGWLQAMVLLVSESDFALRIIPMLAFILISYLLFYISITFFPKQTPWLGFISVAIFNSSVLLQWLGISLTPEILLIVVTLLIVLLMYRIEQQNTWQNWLLLGFCFGLAALTKYTAILLVFSAMWYMVWAKQYLWLKQSKTWFAVAIALVLLLPILIWNAQHDWLSFKFQLQHGFEGNAWSIMAFLRMQLIQIGVYWLIIYLGGVVALIWTWRKNNQDAATRLLICFSLPILVFFSIAAATGGRSLPHWTAVGWVVLIPLVAFWLVHHWPRRMTRIFIVTTGVFALVMVILAHLLLVTPPLRTVPVLRYAVVDLVGWQEAAEFADTLRANRDLDDLYVTNWSHASRIAWYARPTPVHVTQDRFTQFSLWYDKPVKHKAGIMVLPAAKRDKQAVTPVYKETWGFHQCELIDILSVIRDTVEVNEFYFYQCE